MPLASEAGGDWSIVTSPNIPRPHENFLSGVTCLSASDCWAVGYSWTGTGGAKRTLIEHWNGTEWTVVPSPNTGAQAVNGDLLLGVTCVSASDCWAVGYSRAAGAEHTLIEHWNGTEWTVVTSPNTSATRSNELSGVTCTSASDCWAVGFGLTAITYQTLIVRWDGTSWAIVSSPNANPTATNLLSGVTCTSASDCWAVGYYFAAGTGSAKRTLIEHWDGTSWAIVISPNTLPTQNNILSGVTCTSASDCWAVGFYTGNADQTLIERWDGTLWTIVTSPNASAAEDNVLSGVTCTSASDCWATGYYYNPADGIDHTLIERWNGSSWAIVTSPNATATQDNVIYGVACASASDCFAVGAYYLPDFGDPNRFIDQTLIEHWNGTEWAIDASPSTSDPQDNRLVAVTCVSASDCWAVGHYLTNIADQTLIERWDGNSWTVVTSPNTSPMDNNLLHGVRCVSASDCWSVGFYYNPAGGAYQTLIQRWNGTSWSFVTSPNASAAQDNVLYDVTCVSASDCWAVGYHYDGSADQTLVERWDGVSWEIVTSPSANPGVKQNNYLFTVTCASAANCWAVGFYYNPTAGAYQTLIEQWNGTSWAIVTSPNPNPESYLYGVTCASASDCWAVGFSNAAGTYQTLIERWNGSNWAIVTSPNANQGNVLRGATCASASDCWAVGYYYNLADGIGHTLIERWDGASWAIVTSPNTSATQDNVPRAVTCASASDCWAVGYYGGNTGRRQTLTMRYEADPQADLSITKVDDKDRAATGRNLTYTLSVTNNGPDPASGVVVTDTLPGTVTWVSTTPSQGTCSGTATVTCNLGTMANGATATIQIVVKPTQVGQITNVASVTSSTTDPNLANNTASEPTTICRITSRRSSIPCG